ncbi:unnamed protein product [Urochloa humidicola]
MRRRRRDVELAAASDAAVARGGHVVAQGNGVAARHIPGGDGDRLPFFTRGLRHVLAGNLTDPKTMAKG